MKDLFTPSGNPHTLKTIWYGVAKHRNGTNDYNRYYSYSERNRNHFLIYGKYLWMLDTLIASVLSLGSVTQKSFYITFHLKDISDRQMS